MSMREHADSLFSLLSSKLGGGTVNLDEQGRAFFSLGETLYSAALVEEAETLVLSAIIGQLQTGAQRGELLRDLARANFNWGGTADGAIGLQENTDLVFLHRRFFLPLQRPEDFPTQVARQLALARHWAAYLNKTAEPALATAATRV